MWEIPDQAQLQERVGQQLLGPLEDANALARRYREVDAVHDLRHRARAAGDPGAGADRGHGAGLRLAPIMALVGTSAVSALAGMLLTPVMLIGSLFVLGLVFFSWLEERSLARTLGRRRAREPRVMRWMRKKLGADLVRAPRVPCASRGTVRGLAVRDAAGRRALDRRDPARAARPRAGRVRAARPLGARRDPRPPASELPPAKKNTERRRGILSVTPTAWPAAPKCSHCCSR